MSQEEIKKDLLSQLLYEAQAYKKFEDIEKLVDGGKDLSMIPIQPMYVALKLTNKDQVALVLPKLSSEQRQALRDIDLWQKDELDPSSAFYWMEVYSKCTDDEIVLEYIKSEDFLLTLKNQFTVQTFDSEDPLYPESDNYFLTEDNQLLIEYPEDFSMVQELKEMIRRLYSDMGVEYAYAFLFKMVVDSYQVMEENNFQEKKERLRDFGFVDYFDALELNSTFLSVEQIDNFIRQKKGLTPHLDNLSLNHGLHATSLVPYQSGMNDIKSALEKVELEERQQYLQFNFVRLVNAKMALEDALKSGSVTMTKVGNHARESMELGFDYVAGKIGEGKVIFEIFDFIDLYKIGHSLIQLTRKKIKAAISSTPFEKDDFSHFLGMYWNAFLENSHENVAKYKFDGSSSAREVKDMGTYQLWNEAAETFISAIPFVETFFGGLEKLKSDGLLNDQFYLNYEVDNIDFEAIIISSLINFVGGHYQESSAGKMGVTISELKGFYHQFFQKKNDEYLIKGEEDPILREKALRFIEKFGLERIPRFDKYLYQILLEQLNGYEIDGMTEEDFRHIGGPILLNYSRN